MHTSCGSTESSFLGDDVFGIQALTLKWKAAFPTMRMLQYRILSAVNYDMVIQNKIQSDPDSVIRWRHKAGHADEPGDGSVCWNGVSGCFNDPKRINNPANKCGTSVQQVKGPLTCPFFLEYIYILGVYIYIYIGIMF